MLLRKGVWCCRREQHGWRHVMGWTKSSLGRCRVSKPVFPASRGRSLFGGSEMEAGYVGGMESRCMREVGRALPKPVGYVGVWSLPPWNQEPQRVLSGEYQDPISTLKSSLWLSHGEWTGGGGHMRTPNQNTGSQTSLQIGTLWQCKIILRSGYHHPHPRHSDLIGLGCNLEF